MSSAASLSFPPSFPHKNRLAITPAVPEPLLRTLFPQCPARRLHVLALASLSCPLSLTRFFHFSSPSHLQTPLAFPLAFSTFTFLLRPHCPAFSTIFSSTFSHSYSDLVFLSCPLSLTRFFHFFLTFSPSNSSSCLSPRIFNFYVPPPA